MICIFKQSNNGEVGILTDHTSADSFISELTEAIITYLQTRPGDEQHDLHWILSNSVKILSNMKECIVQYKEGSVEQRSFMFAGDHWPSLKETPDVTIGGEL